ncbi:peptide/nickel transport system ATP-binding protein [Alkalispirochaeta americana]|uniref:Peptide/nickel transport system ATP-binding protein n=1 Tax=Alkalispirochaeta americana TaxID=159291 RepID=A0A1N6UHP0_9SPIO|nr:ABC transporter ATP-binding protein [Alkalispirochaeta americana]SIQ64846.1 peptide/nickel transport system ATP-binding protein [Alkalispirochaeta americana]
MKTAGIQVRNLRVETLQEKNPRLLVGPLDLRILPGEILALVGESGSGKTLTLRALAGVPPRGLGITASPGDLPLSSRCGMVFQDPFSYFNPRWRMFRSIAEVLRVVRKVPREKIAPLVESLLESVGLSREEGELFPFEMSGGMAQRSAIAIALAVDPQVLCADEATSALDPATRDRILHLIAEICRQRCMAAVVVSHDLPGLVGHADRVVVMYRGLAVEEGAAEVVLRESRHRYTDFLVRCHPGIHTRGGKLPEIPPDAFKAEDEVSQHQRGCPFAGRCPGAAELCLQEMPPWQGGSTHRFRCFYPARGTTP